MPCFGRRNKEDICTNDDDAANHDGDTSNNNDAETKHVQVSFFRICCCCEVDTDDDSDDDDDDDNVDGYGRLQAVELQETVFTIEDADDDEGAAENMSRSQTETQGQTKGGYDVDKKGRRLHRKLKRKQVRKRIRHYIHSTCKWLRRGMAAVGPGLGAIFLINQPPTSAYVNPNTTGSSHGDKFRWFM